MNANIYEYRHDRLIALELINISLTDTISSADLNTKWHSLRWLQKQLKLLGYSIVEQVPRGTLVTVYFK
jgi:hypothetical protein